MLNRIYAGFDCLAAGLITVTMHRNFFPQPMRFIDQRSHLRWRELRSIYFIRQRKNAAGNGSFDYICAVFDFEPDRLANVIRPVGDPISVIRFAAKKEITKPARRIEVTASGTDSFGRD